MPKGTKKAKDEKKANTNKSGKKTRKNVESNSPLLNALSNLTELNPIKIGKNTPNPLFQSSASPPEPPNDEQKCRPNERWDEMKQKCVIIKCGKGERRNLMTNECEKITFSIVVGDIQLDVTNNEQHSPNKFYQPTEDDIPRITELKDKKLKLKQFEDILFSLGGKKGIKRVNDDFILEIIELENKNKQNAKMAKTTITSPKDQDESPDQDENEALPEDDAENEEETQVISTPLAEIVVEEEEQMVPDNLPIPSTDIELTRSEKDLQEQFMVEPSDVESNEYNKYLFNKEKLEQAEFKNADPNDPLSNLLYPHLNDPNFNIKIAKRKEFYDTKYDGQITDVEAQSNKMCDASFELLPHQLFVKNFLSLQTPYNCLLLYHGLGTGKTCSAIGIAEEMRGYMKQVNISQRILVIASPNVQQNFKLQLFDERKLTKVGGLWNLNTCIGNALLSEINPTNLQGLPQPKVIAHINGLIQQYYTFMGYIELANYIKKKTKLDVATGYDTDLQVEIKKIRKHFNNRLIIIDEVHNIRMMQDNKQGKKTAGLLMRVVKYAENIRVILLSATPMYNSYKEIIWLTNLMNKVDGRSEIKEEDVFNQDGTFVPSRTKKDGSQLEEGSELLKRKLTGYVSYVRGENPYTFPYRIYPDVFSPENSLTSPNIKYPATQMNKKTVDEPLINMPVYINKIRPYQQGVYDFIMKYLHDKPYDVVNGYGKERKMPTFENMESFGYNHLRTPIQSLNIVYPNAEFNKKMGQFGGGVPEHVIVTVGNITLKVKRNVKNDLHSPANIYQPTEDDIPRIEELRNWTGKKLETYLRSLRAYHYQSWTDDMILDIIALENKTKQEESKIIKLPNDVANSSPELPEYNQQIYGSESNISPPTDSALESTPDIQFKGNEPTSTPTPKPENESYVLPEIQFKKQEPSNSQYEDEDQYDAEEEEEQDDAEEQEQDDDEEQSPLADEDLDANGELIQNMVGSKGLSNVMTYETSKYPIELRYNFEYKPEYAKEPMFSPKNINKYSCKLANICECIKKSTGIIMIYSQYIDGGVVPAALALEEMGFTRYGSASHTKSLFKTPPIEPIDSLTMMPRTEFVKQAQNNQLKFSAAKYVMITGDKHFSPNNLADLKYVTNDDNKYGEKVKVILITKAAAEGLDFKNIRQIHVLEPWYNMNRIEQIIGRGVRNLSHCSLPFKERNVEIYLHATLLQNDEESADLYVYRFAKKKAEQIGKVTRIMKTIAIDCILNIGQTKFTIDNFKNQNVKQIFSSQHDKTETDFILGDKPHTEMCDYMENCNDTCSPMEAIDETKLVKNAYNDEYAKMNYSSIVKRIRQLYREQSFYKRDTLFLSIKILREYPDEHIDYALSRFIDNKNELIVDKYGNAGYLINIEDVYAFQPIEVTDERSSILERSTPVSYRHNKLNMDLPTEKDSAIDKKIKKQSRLAELAEKEDANSEIKNKIESTYDTIINSIRKQITIIETEKENAANSIRLQNELKEIIDESAESIIRKKNILKEQKEYRLPHGENDWFKHLGRIYNILTDIHKIPVDSDIVQNGATTKLSGSITKYAIYHLLDTFSIEDRLILLYFIYKQSNLEVTNKIQAIIKAYFDDKIIKVRGKNCIFLATNTNNKTELYVQNVESNQWISATKLEIINAEQPINEKFKIERNIINDIVGFMHLFKNNEMVFKTKNMLEKRNNIGASCNIAGKQDLIKRINLLIKDDPYALNVEKYNDINTEYIMKPGLCVILEIIMRHYNNNANMRNKRVWFLTAEQTIASNLIAL